MMQSQKNLLAEAKAAREERARERVVLLSAITLQSAARKFLAVRRFRRRICSGLDEALNIAETGPCPKSALDVFFMAKKYLLFIYQANIFDKRLEDLCKYILKSFDSTLLNKSNYVSVMYVKDHTLNWITHIKTILEHVCNYLNHVKDDLGAKIRSNELFMQLLVTVTSTETWGFLKGKPASQNLDRLCANFMGHLVSNNIYPIAEAFLVLCSEAGQARAKLLRGVSLVVLRPASAAKFSSKLTSCFAENIMTTTAYVHLLEGSGNEAVVQQLVSERVFTHCLEFLSEPGRCEAFALSVGINKSLAILGNLLHLGSLEVEGIVDKTPKFLKVVSQLMNVCRREQSSKSSSKSHYHPVLGWVKLSEQPVNDRTQHINAQLARLWSPKVQRLLFADLFEYVDTKMAAKNAAADRQRKNPSKPASRASRFLRSFSYVRQPSADWLSLSSPVLQSTCLTCLTFQEALTTFSQSKLSILSGLSYQGDLLHHLWIILWDIGPNFGLKAFKSLVSTPGGSRKPLGALLTLFCEGTSHLIGILDDPEMYELQVPFKLQELVTLSEMLNNLIFSMIWHNYIDVKDAESDPLFSAAYELMMLLHEKDSRRQFTPLNHWLIKEIKPSVFVDHIQKGNKQAQFLLQKMSHIIPHYDRVILFRKLVATERQSAAIGGGGRSAVYICVRRTRLVEDGYSQLAALPPSALKCVIRVKFVNEQGLAESGIDQDGVFKEFLEDIVKTVFNPNFNLFKETCEQRLYPSSSSFVEADHLRLMEFVGKILGKAVYEGIVIDVTFAQFFLTQILGNVVNRATYSFLDELPSLDPDLYKNLTFVKHYDGDISELDLTFSLDENILGKIVTHELIPGGNSTPVTNDNRISYVHLTAMYKMHRSIRDQVKAFRRGFLSVVNLDWLGMFSTPEFQKLISGDTSDIDICDLKRHTSYCGGFHKNHRVITWLWEILEKDFTVKERSSFLKFVTSCSKPPLLGFSNMDPPFSIRCVQVSEDRDTGDTLGTVLKGLFNINRRENIGRLPTASTCFNLLKLPNYNRKSVLKEKLRYSITSNAGFELS